MASQLAKMPSKSLLLQHPCGWICEVKIGPKCHGEFLPGTNVPEVLSDVAGSSSTGLKLLENSQ